MVSSNNAIDNTVGASITGVTNTLTVTNPSDTASSAARATITVGGGSAADPSLNFNVSGVTDFEMGIDNNDSDNFKLSASAALGTTDTFVMTTGGTRFLPLQPQFFAYVSADIPNVTGDSTTYTVVYDAEEYDVGANFDTATGVFTAPVAGTYLFCVGVNFIGITSAHTGQSTTLSFSTAAAQRLWENNLAAIRASTDTAGVSAIGIAQLAASETARVNVQVGNGTKVIDIRGRAGAFDLNYFSGYLLG